MNFDSLAVVMITLIGFISLCVARFAARYLNGNKHYYRFFCLLGSLTLSMTTMVCADNLLLLLLAWSASNAILVQLMLLKSNWGAAKASGALAAKNHILGFFLVAVAFLIFYQHTGQSSIQTLSTQRFDNSLLMTTALTLLTLGAMIQSAIWPFHQWLLSSLNSPTPVSAIMHAGLVNGGGFLLARFAGLYANHSLLLNLLFIIGIISALIGTFFKLMQNDVKRMLACSTMGQMGFMIAQCGLGLFSAAIAHLCWHGLFKAYLFLASGSAAQEKRVAFCYPPRPASFICSLGCGVLGSYIFSLASAKIWLAPDTTLVLLLIAFIGTAHFALPILRHKPLAKLPIALIVTAIVGGIYGFNVHMIELILGPNSLRPQPLNIFYVVGALLLVTVWIIAIFWQSPRQDSLLGKTFTHLYVRLLNASQPHPATITTHRNYYNYL